MNIPEIVSHALMTHIKKTLPEKEATELEEINYGLQVFINSLIEVPIIFIIALIIGLFKYTLVAFLAFTLVRAFASGIHAVKPIFCFISTSAIFLGSALLGNIFKLDFTTISAIFLVCLLLVALYAPSDTENRPLVSKKLRRRLKFYSCLSIITLYIIATALINTHYSSVITISVLIECITITPVVYSIFKRRYKNYETFSS